MSLPVFDNHDTRIPYYELLLERSAPFEFPHREPPAGYHFETYAPGDRDAWIAIEHSARELTSREQGLEVWEKYYAAHEAELPGRMFFLVNESGEKVATATAFYDVIHQDPEGAGWLHWVAVRREDQGRGLARPLIGRALERLAELGYRKIKIPTQTTTWVAARLYLDFGFRPIPANAVHSREGWRVLRRLTNHPALAAFSPAADEEMLAPALFKLREHPDLLEPAAAWFHEKWGAPLTVYRESMADCLAGNAPVPQWYTAVNEGKIIGGLGVIENDFHDRKDLAPNICAVFVEPAWRGRGVAGRLLDLACADMAAQGVPTLYLLTDHVGFYERYGWEFYCLAQGDGEPKPSRMYVHRG